MNLNKLFLLLTIFSSAAFAKYAGPLATKYSSSGTVSPPYQHSKTCQLYSDKAVIMTTSGSIKSQETKAIKTNRDELLKTIDAAAKGKITRSDQPVGGSLTQYVAIQLDAIDAVTKVDLAIKAGNAAILTNDAPEASTLQTLLDLICN